ncbi:MAG: AsmA-like C-terminal region-containing protein [Prevotellaceae bacterium]|jgi:uncharacterized protein involved in outer membrane biogenesis|nr:AsmA-like C-terminal region-containing protein [Prevotellaceae bacterium]
MKKGLKIAGIVLGVLLLLMFLLPVAFQGKITDLVKSEGNKMLRAQFDFDKLSISLFKNFPKASVTLNNFWLKGVGAFDNDTLINAGELSASVDLFSLFGDNYEISKVSMEDVSVKAVVLADGQVNWDIMKPDSDAADDVAASAESSPFSMQLKKLTAKNIRVIYDDRQGNMYADIRKLNATCSGNFGSERTTIGLDAEIGALTYRMGGMTLLSKAHIAANMKVDADLVNNKFTLQKNEFRLNAIKAGIDGWVALKDPAIEMDMNLVTSEVGFKEILSLIPAVYAQDFKGLKTDGTATVTAHAKGMMQGDTLPQFDVTMEVKNAMFRYPSLPAGVDHINIHAQVTNPGGSADLTQVTVNPFNFRLAGNDFGMTAEVRTPVSDPDFKVAAQGVLDLGKVKEVYPLQDMTLNGVVNADMSLAGRMSYLDKEQYDRFNAAGTIRLNDMKLQLKEMPDVLIQKSLFTFSPRYLQLSETTVHIGKNDLTVDSRFENYLAYIMKGKTLKGNLNIRSNHFNLNDFMTADSTATATAADTTTLSLVVIPRNIDFAMTADMKEVQMGDIALRDVKGKLNVANGKADMSNLSMNTLGGNVVMNGYYSTADASKPELNAAFKMNNLSFAETYKGLGMVQKLAPIFENLKGNFSGSMNVQTELDNTMSPVLTTLQGNGSLSTQDLALNGVSVLDQIADAAKKPELKNITVKDMNLDFTIKDGRVATKPFDIKWKEYNLNLSGTTGLDQTIDYTGKISLPASTGIGKYTTLDLKINGDFTSPQISLDTESMAKQAVDAVKDQVKEQVKDQIKEKAGDKLLDLLNKNKKK